MKDKGPSFLLYINYMEKETYWLDPKTPMWDMCYCCANCRVECARKKISGGICTVSDFSSACSDYIEDKKDD